MESSRLVVLHPLLGLVFFVALIPLLAFSATNSVGASRKDGCPQMQHDGSYSALKGERCIQEFVKKFKSNVMVVKDELEIVAGETAASNHSIVVGGGSNNSLISSEHRDVYEAAVSGRPLQDC